jgi:hypothetical protein
MAYAQRKESLGGQKQATGRRGSEQLTDTMARIARLEAENQRLEAENQRLFEQFVVWAYNAHTRGLDKEFLSHPLPRVNRGQTVPPKFAKKTAGKR